MHSYYLRRQWHPTPVLLAGKSHGWRILVGCSPWSREESDRTEWLHFHFSLSCIGEGNGNPLQCSCLETPRGGGAWWAAVYAVAQSWTWLKWLSSSSIIWELDQLLDFPRGSVVKNPPANQEMRVWSLGQEDPWRRKWQPTPVFFPGKSWDMGAWQAAVHGTAKELDTT